MEIILDVMTNLVILISSIFVVVGILLYVIQRFAKIKQLWIIRALKRLSIDAMVIGVGIISMYTVVYIVI